MSWSLYKEIVYTNIPSSNLTGFPKKVHLVTDSDIATELGSGGGIKFTTADGLTDLAFGLYPDTNLAAGTVLARVKVDLSATANLGDPICRLYYSSSESTTEDKAGTVDSYTLFMPLEEDPSGSSPQMLDWVSETNVGASAGTMTSGDLVTGEVGKGLELDGTNDQIVIASAPTLGTDYTVEVILQYDASNDQFARLISLANDASNGVNLAFGDGNLATSTLVARCRRIGIDYFKVTTAAIDRGTRYGVAVRFSGGNTTAIFVNGVSVATGAGAGSIAGDTSLRIGSSGAANFFGGLADEFRFSASARSDAWLAFAYADDFDVTDSGVMSHEMGVGGVTATSFKYRARTDKAATLEIEYSTASNLSGSTTSAGVTTASGDDFTGGEEITGLSANTTYYYSIKVDGVRQHSSTFPSFKTLPAAGVDAALKVAFGSCQTDGDSATVFGSVASEAPNLVIHLGDFGYPDSTTLSTQRNNYRSQHANSYLTSIVRAFPVERVWDDHDYGPNNSHGDTSGKENSLQAWKEYTAYHDLANASNGIWRKFTAANVEFFMLDVRYQREGTQARFPAAGTNTADTGSGGTTLVLASADSPSASDDAYNGWYVSVEGVVRRVTDYVGATRTATLDASVTGLDSSSTYFLKRASILDQDNLGATGQVAWLIDGVNNSTRRWKVICTPIPFNATEPGADAWGGWDTAQLERAYLVQEITADNVILISGDFHSTALDDGTNSDWPELTASPFKQSDSSPGGTWSNGTDTTGAKYGLLTFSTSPHQVVMASKDADGTTTASVTPLTVPDAGGGGLSIPIAMYHYRHRIGA